MYIQFLRERSKEMRGLRELSIGWRENAKASRGRRMKEAGQRVTATPRAADLSRSQDDSISAGCCSCMQIFYFTLYISFSFSLSPLFLFFTCLTLPLPLSINLLSLSASFSLSFLSLSSSLLFFLPVQLFLISSLTAVRARHLSTQAGVYMYACHKTVKQR